MGDVKGSGGPDLSATAKKEFESVKDQVRESLDQQKKTGADQFKGVARAIHSAADELKQELPQTAGYIHDAAERVEHFATMIGEKPAEDLLHEVHNFARRRPIALFGASLLAGFAVARFLKSSAPDRSEPKRDTTDGLDPRPSFQHGV